MIFSEDIKNCLDVLKNGGVILYPTDTIWGLGCDSTNPAAVQKIFNIKSREEDKSLLILVNGFGMLERYVKEIPLTASDLINVSDSPLTIIYPSGKNLADGVCAGDGSVGIRICNEEFCNELISRFRKPLVSTSANLSGKPSPLHYGEIESEITGKVDYIVKYRQNDRQKHSPSPVIKVENDGSFKIIRK
ncbi:MAG TPA: L-threonylcarbamoyladenylate synthase [Bacteroidales bacterium]|nr:L-threonylcarbamoyladenylate synthase [Bacteroidales bacterium]